MIVSIFYSPKIQSESAISAWKLETNESTKLPPGLSRKTKGASDFAVDHASDWLFSQSQKPHKFIMAR